jgi:hypothetical protein
MRSGGFTVVWSLATRSECFGASHVPQRPQNSRRGIRRIVVSSIPKASTRRFRTCRTYVPGAPKGPHRSQGTQGILRIHGVHEGFTGHTANEITQPTRSHSQRDHTANEIAQPTRSHHIRTRKTAVSRYRGPKLAMVELANQGDQPTKEITQPT